MPANLASQLKPLALFGGLTAEDLFPSNNLVMIAWALLVICAPLEMDAIHHSGFDNLALHNICGNGRIHHDG